MINKESLTTLSFIGVLGIIVLFILDRQYSNYITPIAFMLGLVSSMNILIATLMFCYEPNKVIRKCSKKVVRK